MNMIEDLTHHPAYHDALEWFLKLRQDPENSQLLTELASWLSEDPSHEDCYLELMMLWEDLGEVPQLSTAVVNDVVTDDTTGTQASILQAPNSKNRHSRIAMLLSCLFCTLLILWAVPEDYRGLIADHRTGTAEYKTVTLDDGTEVQINARTALNIRYSDQQRVVELLYGEAYFKVAKDRQRPFIVLAEQTQTEALGTAFNIRITENDLVETHLVEGRVRVSVPDVNEVQMLAGQQLIWQQAQGIRLQQDRLNSAPAWLQQIMRADEMPLEEVVQRINRHYTAMIRVLDPELNSVTVSGTIPLNDLETVLVMLQQSLNIEHTSVTGNLVLLHR